MVLNMPVPKIREVGIAFLINNIPYHTISNMISTQFILRNKEQCFFGKEIRIDKIPMSQFPEDLILQYEKMTGLSYSSFTGICWC